MQHNRGSFMQHKWVFYASPTTSLLYDLLLMNNDGSKFC